MPSEKVALTNLLIKNLVKGDFISLLKILLHHTPDTEREEAHVFRGDSLYHEKPSPEWTTCDCLSSRLLVDQRALKLTSTTAQRADGMGVIMAPAGVLSWDSGPT